MLRCCLLLLFLFPCLPRCLGQSNGRFPALWFGTIPSSGYPLTASYNFSNYSLVLLGFTYPDAHNEQTLLRNAERVRQYSAPSPPPVFVYRNAHIALKSFDLQAQAMATLPPSVWIRNGTAAAAGVGPCRLFDGSLAYNFTLDAASQFFLNALVREAASESSAVSGVFFDEVDWATCGFLESECGALFSESDKEGLWRATAATMASAATLLAASGKSTVQSLFAAFRANLGSIDSQPCRHAEEDWLAAMPQPALQAHRVYRFYGDLGWFGAQGGNTSVCEAYIQNMIDEAQRVPAVGKVVRAVLSPSSSEQDVEALAAAALLSLDNHTHIGFSTGWGDKDWKWWPILDKAIGVPKGRAMKRGPAWVRQFTLVTAEYSCETRAGSLTWAT
jgi:hypothetical protein